MHPRMQRTATVHRMVMPAHTCPYGVKTVDLLRRQGFTVRAVEWFIGLSMCVLALLKLQDVERFSSMFLGYDLLAQRWVPYSYLYPFAEATAGVLMVAGALQAVSVPLALFIGGLG